jgi:hypothetical protein
VKACGNAEVVLLIRRLRRNLKRRANARRSSSCSWERVHSLPRMAQSPPVNRPLVCADSYGRHEILLGKYQVVAVRVEVICLSDNVRRVDADHSFLVRRILRGQFWPLRVLATTFAIWRAARLHDLLYVNGLGSCSTACRPALPMRIDAHLLRTILRRNRPIHSQIRSFFFVIFKEN